MQNANVHEYARIYFALCLKDSSFFHILMSLSLRLKHRPFSFHLFCSVSPSSLSVCHKDMM